MRAFILVALLAMAATVSCQDFNASPACKNATEVLYNNTNVAAAINNNGKGGCTEISFGDSCSYDEPTGVFTCACVTTYENKTTVDAAVTGAGGQSCYIDFRIEFAGNQTYNNATRPVTLIATQTGLAYLALASACNVTDKTQAWQTFLDLATAPFDNFNLNKGNATWSSATFIVSGCEAERRVTKTFTASGGTTAPPSGTTTAPPTGTTTAPPTSSSTGGGKSGASVVASSAALVASLIAAVAVLA